MSAPTQTVNDNTNGSPAVEVPKEDEGFRVYIGNLSFKATEEEVREFAATAGGEIVSVVLPQRFKRPAGFAFVSYKTEAEANNAVEKLNDTELDGRKVTLQVARSREEQAQRREAIIEKRDEAKAAKAEAKKAAAGANGTTEGEGEDKPKKKRASKRTSRRRVPGQEDEDGEASEGGDKPKTTKSRQPRESRIDGEATQKKPKEKKPHAPRLELTGEESPNTIFVANLPFNVDDAALAAIFTNLSIRVKSAKVVQGLRRSKGGRPFRSSRGFGFVEVEDPAQQKEAVEKVEGSLIDDRTISAKIANEMKPVETAEVAEAEAGE